MGRTGAIVTLSLVHLRGSFLGFCGTFPASCSDMSLLAVSPKTLPRTQSVFWACAGMRMDARMLFNLFVGSIYLVLARARLGASQ